MITIPTVEDATHQQSGTDTPASITPEQFLSIMERHVRREATRHLDKHRRYNNVDVEDLEQEARFALIQVWTKYISPTGHLFRPGRDVKEFCVIGNRAIYFHFSNLLEKEIMSRRQSTKDDYRVRQRENPKCPGCGTALKKQGERCANGCSRDARKAAVRQLRVKPDTKAWNETTLQSLVYRDADGEERTLEIPTQEDALQILLEREPTHLNENTYVRAFQRGHLTRKQLGAARKTLRRMAVESARYSDPLASALLREQTTMALYRAVVRNRSMERWGDELRNTMHNGAAAIGYVEAEQDMATNPKESMMEGLKNDGPMDPGTETVTALAATSPLADAPKAKRVRKPKAAKKVKEPKPKAAKKPKAEKVKKERPSKDARDAESAKAAGSFKKGDAVSYRGGAKIDEWLSRGTHLSVQGLIVNRGRSYVKARVTGGKNEGRDTVIASQYLEKVA